MIDLIYRVTFRCNKQCYFCYNEVFDEKVNYNEYEKTDISPLITFIRRNNIKRISISGGEPTVRDDLPELIKQLNKVANIKMFSNGNVFDKYSLEEILDFNLEKIVITIYDKDILGNKKFDEYLEKIYYLRNKGIIVEGNMFLDSNYFKKREKVINNKLHEKFDNIRWQPLVLPKQFKQFKTTIFGMEDGLRRKIFSSVIEDNWGDVSDYYKAFEQYIEKNRQPYPCKFPKCVCTVDPDLTVKICPHKNDVSYTFDEIENNVNKMNFDNCLSPRCLGIYKFDNNDRSLVYKKN